MKIILPLCMGLAGCVETSDDLMGTTTPIGADGQDQVCASRLADELDVPMSAIRVNSRDTSPVGNSVVFVQATDDSSSASCEITDGGTIVGFNRLG
ncbi:hypothetical protein LCM08_17780 [Salipiger pacificus]|nr:hypothetical protein [Alloyangia pacifica]